MRKGISVFSDTGSGRNMSITGRGREGSELLTEVVFQIITLLIKSMACGMQTHC